MRWAAVSFIEDSNGLLLCVWNKRYEGWSLPGGMVEEGESLAAAQSRELYEETGLRTGVSELVFSGEHGLRPKEGDRGGRASSVAIFRVRPVGTPRQTEPGSPVAWLTREEFLQGSPFAPFYRELFAQGIL